MRREGERSRSYGLRAMLKFYDCYNVGSPRASRLASPPQRSGLSRSNKTIATRALMYLPAQLQLISAWLCPRGRAVE